MIACCEQNMGNQLNQRDVIRLQRIKSLFQNKHLIKSFVILRENRLDQANQICANRTFRQLYSRELKRICKLMRKPLESNAAASDDSTVGQLRMTAFVRFGWVGAPARSAAATPPRTRRPQPPTTQELTLSPSFPPYPPDSLQDEPTREGSPRRPLRRSLLQCIHPCRSPGTCATPLRRSRRPTPPRHPPRRFPSPRRPLPPSALQLRQPPSPRHVLLAPPSDRGPAFIMGRDSSHLRLT
jgi:hypothetical protein